MAIESITAKVNQQAYKLTQEGSTDTYSAEITAPGTASNYNISVSVTDDAGNTTTVDSSDAEYKNILALKVSDPYVDLRSIILTNELGDRMLDMVAPVYDSSQVALYLFQALGTTLQKDVDFVSGDFISQIFPQTATWGLKYFEEEYGLNTDISKTLEQRRQMLMSLMFQKKPLTPYRIKQLVKGITGIDCDILENYAPNTFKVIVRGYFENVNLIKEVLDEKAPAHLNYVIQFAELIELSLTATSGFCVSECEFYEVEVSQ